MLINLNLSDKMKVISFFIHILLVVCCVVSDVSGISVTEHCSAPLGMEDGRIKDYQLNASSSYQPKLVGPTNARCVDIHYKEGAIKIFWEGCLESNFD